MSCQCPEAFVAHINSFWNDGTRVVIHWYSSVSSDLFPIILISQLCKLFCIAYYGLSFQVRKFLRVASHQICEISMYCPLEDIVWADFGLLPMLFHHILYKMWQFLPLRVFNCPLCPFGQHLLDYKEEWAFVVLPLCLLIFTVPYPCFLSLDPTLWQFLTRYVCYY